MSRSARRILITSIVMLAAFGAVYVVFTGPNGVKPRSSAAQTQPAAALKPAAGSAPEAGAAGTASSQPAASAPAVAATQPLGTLMAVAPNNDISGRDVPPQKLGGLNPRTDSLELEFTRNGAGIAAIPFANIWQTAEAKRQAEAYLKTLGPNDPIDYAKLDAANRYVLQVTEPFVWFNDRARKIETTKIPVMAAHSVVINGMSVSLLSDAAWSQTAPGTFETIIQQADGTPIASITRQFAIVREFDFTIRQSVRNLSDAPLQVKWQQYGPLELLVDKSGYIDLRRFDFGFLPSPKANPDLVLAGDGKLMLDRNAVIKLYDHSITPGLKPQEALDYRRLWPNKTSVSQGYGLSWFASTNRYFGLAIHPIVDGSGAGNRSLNSAVEEVRLDVSASGADKRIFTFLVSPLVTVEPGAQADFSLGVYAGPLDRDVLKNAPYDSLAMNGMIIYQMTSCCSFLTFQWLAKLLLWFLSFLHNYIVFDWGLAIIGLVIVVRSLLHPLTRKSQVNMQRFAKQMGAMKPEIDKLQKKYPNDPKKVQQEQMMLMREHGVNPLQMLGCLPLFLQTPIWIALWAMLYLAFDIRQQPAFYGVFQLFNGWSFLGDLSSQDHFIRLAGDGFTVPLINAHVTSINLLPLLMGVVFFIQQKYLTPPPTPNMTAEQIQQQKIMKVMTVVMMPLFLYSAPCGLTLYMVTSSCIGILESRYIRRHISELELNPPKKKESRLSRLRDPIARAYAARLEEAKKRRDDEPPARFKKRK